VDLFLPASLKHLSLIYYLKSLAPALPSNTSGLSPTIALLVSTAQPATLPIALTAIALLTVTVLILAAVKSRKLQINYAAD